ncbi:glycosyltransferase [Luteolibacter pohnpeiensis]|nr:glycosyltransferase [Luteolibacter pohnpeiensis]
MISSDSPKEASIAAIFATMSRPETALRCVESLAQQTHPPDLVVVAINDPTDGTIEALTKITDLPFRLNLHHMASNRGNAGGIEEAMEIAFHSGVDAAWILDDDSWPQKGALQAIHESGFQPEIVKHAQQLDPATSRLTWPLPFFDENRNWKLAWKPEDLPNQLVCNTTAAWTGAVITRKIYEDVGPVNGELFIRGEDEEYPWRIGKAGYRFQLVKNAIMDHPGPKNLLKWSFLGKNLFFEKKLPDWKLHYKVRNMVWLKKKQSGNLKALMMALSYLGVAILIDGPGRIPLLIRAISDGWKGKLGKIPTT